MHHALEPQHAVRSNDLRCFGLKPHVRCDVPAGLRATIGVARVVSACILASWLCFRPILYHALDHALETADDMLILHGVHGVFTKMFA